VLFRSRNLPTGVTRMSAAAVIAGPMLGAPCVIERYFSSVKGRPSFPIRVDLKSAGPELVARMRTPSPSSSGESMMSPAVDPSTSRQRMATFVAISSFSFDCSTVSAFVLVGDIQHCAYYSVYV
jgi:hypothetical protein